MEFLEQMIVAIEHYPADSVKLEIIDVDYPGESLNESETGTFRVKVTNEGPLDMTNVTLQIQGKNNTLVKNSGAIAPLVDHFTSPALVNVPSGRSVVSPGTTSAFRFGFQAPSDEQASTPLIKVTLNNWDASLDGLLKSRSNGGENPSAVYAAEVVGL